MSTSGYSFYTSGASKQPEESTWKYFVRKLFTIKSMNSIEVDQKSSGLKRTLNMLDLIMIGLGGIIGTGIFVLTGTHYLFTNKKKGCSNNHSFI